MAQETDKKVQALISMVNEKRDEIKKASKPNWITNCSFRYTEDRAEGFNIQTITDTSKLVHALAFLKTREGAFDEAAAELGTKDKFDWLGYSVEDWTTDFQTRITKVNITKKKKELALLESRLDKIISPELKAQMEIDAITKELDEIE
jgi:hypothetical protein